MPVVDSGSRVCFPDSSDYHLSVFVIDHLVWQREYDTEVHISKVVKDCATSRASPKDFDRVLYRCQRSIVSWGAIDRIPSDQGVVDLEPGVLICTDDNAWLVHVKK